MLNTSAVTSKTATELKSNLEYWDCNFLFMQNLTAPRALSQISVHAVQCQHMFLIVLHVQGSSRHNIGFDSQKTNVHGGEDTIIFSSYFNEIASYFKLIAFTVSHHVHCCTQLIVSSFWKLFI